MGSEPGRRMQGASQSAQSVRQCDVIIEQVSENELRIRRARVIPEDEIRFSEEAPIVLTDRERERFLRALDEPPEPNAALRRLMASKGKKRG